MRVVRVVHNDFEGVFIKDIAASRRLEERRRKSAQTIFDIVAANVQTIRQGGGKHGVLHIVHRTPFKRCGNQMRPHQRRVCAFIVKCDHVPVHALLQHHRAATGTNVRTYQGVIWVHRDIADVFGAAVPGHF